VEVWSGVLALGATSLALTLGCGSRTSMLDPDVYATDGGGSSSGGTNGVSRGGKTAAGGKPGTSSGAASGLDPGAAQTPCANYCAGFAPLCPARLNGEDCTPLCVREVSSASRQCQTLGIRALECLTPFLKPNSGGCQEVVSRAMLECGEVVDQFQQCADSDDVPVPQPDLRPNPSACPSMSGAVARGCTATFACSGGSHVTNCALLDDADHAFSCSCARPDGITAYHVVIDTPENACLQMAAYCY
jgi:hypothetical protein